MRADHLFGLARYDSFSQAARVLSTAPDDTRSLTTPYGKVELYSRDAGFAVAVVGRYMIQITKVSGHHASVNAMRCAFADLATRYDKFSCIAVVEAGAKLRLPPDVREGYGGLIKRYSPRFSGVAIVYEKSGFQATALRSLITAINLASRASHAHHVFADLREGVSWVAKLTAPEPTPAGLVHIVQLLRETLQNDG